MTSSPDHNPTAEPIRIRWITPAATIRAMPTAEGRSSLATPISKAATIALGIPLTEAAAAASRISYPPEERACCTASRLTKLRHCSDGLMTAGDLENLG